MTDATAAPYYVARLTYAIRAEGHFCGTPMVCISLVDYERTFTPNHIEPEQIGVEVMSASQVAERALQTLARKFRRCGVAHNEPYPARGAWCYLGGEGVLTAELHALVAALQDLGFYVALETDAKASNYLGAGLDWVCVAANIHGNDTEVHREAVGTADELRFLIYKPTDVDFALAFCNEFVATEGQARTVSVQPVGATNELAKGICIKQALAWGWRVSMMAYPMPSEAAIKVVDARFAALDAAGIPNGGIKRLQ